MPLREGKYLTFTLNDEGYGIGILKIKEIMGIMPITSVPRTPEFVKGVINLRGKVIPVVNLRLRFGMDEIEFTDRTCIIVVEIEARSGSLLMGAITNTMMALQTGVESYVFEGIEKISAYAPVELTGWSIGVTQPRVEFLGAAKAIRNVIAIVGIIFLAATILGLLFFARSITKPIQRIIKGLNDGASQVASASGQVSAASQSLAEGSSEQAASIEETSSSLEEMSSMTRRNAGNANEVRAQMEASAKLVQKVDNHMKEMAEAITEITKTSDETGKIIKTIDALPDQPPGPRRGRGGG